MESVGPKVIHPSLFGREREETRCRVSIKTRRTHPNISQSLPITSCYLFWGKVLSTIFFCSVFMSSVVCSHRACLIQSCALEFVIFKKSLWAAFLGQEILRGMEKYI